MNGVVLVVIVAALTAVYVLARSYWWPWGPCPRCQGRKGRGLGSAPKAYSRCGACGGKGERIRPLARLLWRRWREEAKK